MGFLPAMRRIVKALPKQRQTMMFSATLSKEIETLTNEFLVDAEVVQVGRRANPAESVTQFVYETTKEAKLPLLLHLLRDTALDSVLVFSRTKHGADKIARKLASSGINTATLHSNRSQSQRIAALKAFKAGTVRVLVATDIAARGIDVEGISHVVNFDFPPQPEDYVHRIGRTGRAKAIGDAISFVTPDDRGNLRDLERFISRGIPRKVAEGFDASAYKAVAPAMTSWRPSRPAAPRPQRPNTYASSRPSSRPASGPRPPAGGNGRTAVNSRPQFSDRTRRRP